MDFFSTLYDDILGDDMGNYGELIYYTEIYRFYTVFRFCNKS